VTTIREKDSAFERISSALLLVLFWTAFGCLAAGILLWLAVPGNQNGSLFLIAGLMGLLGMPVLRLVTIIAAAARQRDWLTLCATLAVMAILFALTLRDAARMR
jgi:hypothetical protein